MPRSGDSCYTALVSLSIPAESPSQVAELRLQPDDARRLAILCGQCDQNLRQIEQHLGVQLHNRGNLFRLSGRPQAVEHCMRVLREIYGDTAGASELSPGSLGLYLRGDGEGRSIQVGKKRIRLRTAGQRRYVDAISRHAVIFGSGPAGTGKTWLAVATAAKALLDDRVERIVLVRPAVEAGEKLGFLPGDLSQKVDPYLRPLYDALFDILGRRQAERLIESGRVEVAPLAFMRGRTLNQAFIILDECQNCTSEQMKMFLTRIGFDSTAVLTGDPSQVDLPRGALCGLLHARRLLAGVDGVCFADFDSGDVVRHPVVQRIVDAYAAGARERK